MLLQYVLLIAQLTFVPTATISIDGTTAEISASAPADHVINGPPAGYTFLPTNQVTPLITAVAIKLNKGEYGTTTSFRIGDNYFMARVEHHFHPIPAADATPEEKAKYRKPWGWHHGVTIYKKIM
jgi:hypothetical protein